MKQFHFYMALCQVWTIASFFVESSGDRGLMIGVGVCWLLCAILSYCTEGGARKL